MFSCVPVISSCDLSSCSCEFSSRSSSWSFSSTFDRGDERTTPTRKMIPNPPDKAFWGGIRGPSQERAVQGSIARKQVFMFWGT
eukprot:6402164-Alexandrium_andersonii.AAC.1